jgi:HSP20 family protein
LFRWTAGEELSGECFALIAIQEDTMKLPSLWTSRDVADPFQAMRREMDDFFSSFARRWPTTAEVGLQAPAIDVAETKDAFEVTAELPGVDQSDISLAIDGNRIIISGEKKKESKHDEKDWHTIERSYGSFHRAVAFPFEPKEEAVDARFDKGVLRMTVKKPEPSSPSKKTIEIKPGASEAPPEAREAPKAA